MTLEFRFSPKKLWSLFIPPSLIPPDPDSCFPVPLLSLTVSFINTFGLIINAIAFIAASGGHLFLHAGWFTSVNVYFYKFEAITALYGQGTEILILAGGAAMINTG